MQDRDNKDARMLASYRDDTVVALMQCNNALFANSNFFMRWRSCMLQKAMHIRELVLLESAFSFAGRSALKKSIKI